MVSPLLGAELLGFGGVGFTRAGELTRPMHLTSGEVRWRAIRQRKRRTGLNRFDVFS